MVRRLKVYFIHSTKMDYNTLLYRPIISSSICLRHELMLPHSKKYEGVYVKDLLEDADIIIAEVSNPSFTLKYELKWALETKKPIKYFAFNNTLSPRLEKLVPEIEQITNERPMIRIIEDFISYYSGISKAQMKDPTIILGEL